MPKTTQVIRPDLSSDPLQMICERTMSAAPEVLYRVWTSDQIDRWFAIPGTVLMKPEINVPYFFYTQYDGTKHAHHGRFLSLEPDRLIEMTWQTAVGTKGAETVVRVELTPSGEGTQLRLSHAGFCDEESMKGHAEAWPNALEHLDECVPAGSWNL